MDLEYFSSPASLIASTNMDFEHDKDVRIPTIPGDGTNILRGYGQTKGKNR